MKKVVLLKFLLILAIAGQAWAQTRTVTGRVTGPDGEGLPGVTVVERGTTNGMSTGLNGDYSLVVAENAVLVFSFIGFDTQEIPVSGRNEINVRMSADPRQLSELVVVGYGEQDRRTLTASIATIKPEAIANLATPSFAQQLAGRAPGVQVTTPSGLLGQAPRIRIRGTNTITSGADPLVVVDNVPIITGNQSGTVSTNPLADINPADIASIEVLKDGAATAIYGSRAANGVILITTKKGKAGTGAVVNFETYVGVAEAASRFDLLNAAEFVEIANEKFRNNPPTSGTPSQPAALGEWDTDWQDVIFRRGAIQNYALNFSGGTEKTNYYFSLGYSDQKGAIVANSLNRMTLRANVDHRINRWLEAGTSISLARTRNEGLNTGENALSGNVAGAIRLLPNVPVLDPTNETGFHLSAGNTALGRGPNAQVVHNNYTNLAFVLANNQLRALNNRVLSNSYLQLNIVEGLTLRTQYGLDYLPTVSFLSYDPRHGDGRGSNGFVSQTNREVNRWNWQNILSYNKLVGIHRIGLTLGNEYQGTEISSFTASGSNFSDRFFIQNGLITGTYGSQFSSGTSVPMGFDSYFGRVNYALYDRYLLGFSIRNDGISSLPEANRRGTFMGGSIGYRLSEEAFYANSGLANVMNEIKFRASYGEVGNVDIGAFPYAGTFGSAQYASLNGIAFSQAGNPELQWETSKKIDFGVDLGFLDNRFTLTFDYFQNDVDGLILDAPTPFSVGVPGNSISKNIGSLTNRGFEIGAGGQLIRGGGFTWTLDVNFSSVDNKITSLTRGLDGEFQDILPTTSTGGSYHIVRVGHPIGSFYGIVSAGVNPANGNPLFEKGDGRIVQRNAVTGTFSYFNPESPTDETNRTGAALRTQDVEDGGDRRILGNSNPTWFGGVSNNFAFGNFDLEVFTRFSGGNMIMNVTRQETLLNQDFQNNGREILQRWTTPGQVTNVPKIVEGRSNIINLNNLATTRFLEKGDFVRIQNIVLGYRLPASVLGSGGSFPIRSLRVFAQAQNPFTFSNYSGLDPELSQTTGNSLFGVDNNTNPIFKIYTVGLNLGL